MGKKALCLIFAFLLSINNFAAVVADNDGSAFITKAEFDSLKNDFQSQLNNFNMNIDNKIDSAIASYLAGVKIDKEVELSNNKSILKYPLTIVNFENDLTKEKWNNQSTTGRWWAPDETLWQTYGFGQYYENGTCAGENVPWVQVDLINIDILRYQNNKNSINDFYHIASWDETTGKAIVSGIEKKVKATINHRMMAWTRDDWWAVGAGYGYLYYEAQSAFTSCGNATNLGFTNIFADGDLLCNTSEYPNVAKLSPYFSSEAIGTKTWQSNYERMSAGGRWYKNTAGPADFCINNTVTKTSEMHNYIDKLYNYGNENRYAPVTYSGKIYYSNKRNWKYDYTNASWASFSIGSFRNNDAGGVFSNPKLYGFVDAGWTLEGENNPLKSTANRKWYNMSLINHSHLFYEVNTAVSNSSWGQSFTEGIYLTEVPKGTYESGYLKISVDLSGISRDSYIALSKQPIIAYGTGYIIGDTFMDIYPNKTEITAAKKIKLVNGDNTIYFKKINENDKIFFKLFWDVTGDNWATGSDTNKIIITSEPKIILTKKEG